MPAFHATLFFSQPPKWGWVEQFWWEGPTVEAALQGGQQLARARYSILGAGVSLYAVRVSVPNTPRAGLTAPIAGATLSLPAVPGVQAVEVRVTGRGSRTARRSYKLGGLPIGGVVGGNEVADWSPWLASAGRAWLALLLTGGWRLHVEEPITSNIPLLGIDEIAFQDNNPFGDPLDPTNPPDAGSFCMATAAQHLPAGATSVAIHAARVTPNSPRFRRAVNGTHPLEAQIGNNVYWSGSMEGGSYVGGGYLQMIREALVPIQSAELVRLTARKVGPARAPVQPVSSQQSALPQPTGPSGPSGSPPALRLQPGPPPPGRKVQTARDLATMIFEGYSPTPGQQNQLISVRQVLNADDETYLVCCGGIDNNVPPPFEGNWFNGIMSYAGLPDTFSPYLRACIKTAVPSQSKVILAGHSLGGMACEWMTASFFPATKLGNSHTVVSTITFGSAAIELTTPEPPTLQRFAVNLDPVPYFSPAGYINWIVLPSTYLSRGKLFFSIFMRNLALSPGHTYVDVPDGYSISFYDRHNGYPDYPSLDAYNWNGQKDPDQALPPLVLGGPVFFSWPPP